ncbi:unnamed protein product [Arctogadus glacialis]
MQDHDQLGISPIRLQLVTAVDFYSRRPHPNKNAPDSNSEVVFAPDNVDGFLRDLQQSLSDAKQEMGWNHQPHSLSFCFIKLEHKKEQFFRELEGSETLVWLTPHWHEKIATSSCTPDTPFTTEDASTLGFFQPLSPTTTVQDMDLCQCVRYVPVEIPHQICGCPTEALRLKPGKAVAVITMNGDMSSALPELAM